MSRPETPVSHDFLAPYKDLKSRDKIALKMMKEGDENLEHLLTLPDNIFTKEENLESDKHISINKIIYFLYAYVVLGKFTPKYFEELVKKLVIIDDIKKVERPRQIDFSYIDTRTTHYNLFLMALDQKDVETQRFIIKGGYEIDSETILGLYRKLGNDALRLIKAFVKEDKKKAAPKIDLNFANTHGASILLSAVNKNDVETLEFLVSEGVDLNYQHSLKVGTALINAVSMGKTGAAQFLIKSGANLAATNTDLKTPLMLALHYDQEKLALEIAGEMRGDIDLQKNTTGDGALCYAELYSCTEFLEAYLKGDRGEYSVAVNAKKLLDLMYSQDDAPGNFMENIELQGSFFKRHPLGASKQDNPYLLIAEEIAKSCEGDHRIAVKDGILEVVAMPIPGHVAFIIVEYQKDAAGNYTPIKLSYCDGNLPLSELNEEEYGAGEVCFQVLKKLATNLKLGRTIADIFSDNIKDIITEDGEVRLGKFVDFLARFVKRKDGDLKVIEENIATVAQDRGNCSMKSLTILMRAIRKKIDPTLEFEQRDALGRLLYPDGNGYEEFKAYKNFIIQNCLQDILEIAKHGGANPANSVYSVVLNSLRSSLFQSASKKKDFEKPSESMMAKIIDALHDRGFSDRNISEMKSYTGQNFTFMLLKKVLTRAASYCAKIGIGLAQGSDEENPFLMLFNESKDNKSEERSEMRKSYIRNYKEKSLKDDLAMQLMLAAAQSKSELGEDFMLEMVLGGFDLASKDEKGVAFFNNAYRVNHGSLCFLLNVAEQNEALRLKMMEVYKSRKLSPEAYEWMAFSAIRFGSNKLVFEMVCNRFPLTAQNNEGVDLFSYAFSHSPKFITLLLQRDDRKLEKEVLSEIAKNAVAKICKLKALGISAGYLEKGEARLLEEYEELTEACSIRLKETEGAPELLVERMAEKLPEDARKVVAKLEKRASEKHLLRQQGSQVASPEKPPALEEEPSERVEASSGGGLAQSDKDGWEMLI